MSLPMPPKMIDDKTQSNGGHGSVQGNGDSKAGMENRKICGQCCVVGHELADCAYMRAADRVRGDVSGCPMCNTKDHIYDHCKRLPTGGGRLLQHHMEWLVRRRCHLPMISSKVDIWILVLGFPEYDGGYPWSKVFTNDLSLTEDPVIMLNQKYKHGRFNTGIIDPLTNSLADIKRHINFEVPQKIDAQYFRNNLLVHGMPRNRSIANLCRNQTLPKVQRDRLHQTSGATEKSALEKVYYAGAISAPTFAQRSKTFAEAFGDFLLHDNPKGVADFAFLMGLKDQASRRAEEKQTPQPRHEEKPAIASEPCENPTPEPIAFTPLAIRQEIWAALCPSRKCVGGFPFEVPVPPAARLQKHVLDELENTKNNHLGRRKPTSQRREESLANYIHPHVRIGVTQRMLPDGRSIPVLLVGLVEHAYNLRFSRLGLLQAYDMVVCWASRVESEGVSVSLKGAFDGCNQITEDIVAGENRIEELAVLEEKLERFMPDSFQFDHAVERISQWMERHKAKIVSVPEDRERRLRKWCKKHELGGMGNDLLEQACQQAVEAKTREWKKSKRRTEDVKPDGDIDGARPMKRRRRG